MVVFVASWLVVDVDFKLLPLSCSFPFFLSRESSEDIVHKRVTHNHKMSQIKMMMMMAEGR
jgi:hypothetical protein